MICIPIKKKTFKTTLEHFKRSQEEGDVIEIWFDEINNLSEKNLKQLFKLKKKPILYKLQNYKNYKKILKYNPEYIDIDLKTPKSIISEIKEISPKTQIIISHHNFIKTPPTKDLEKIIKQMLGKKADITKLATKANSISDSIRLISLLSRLKHNSIIIGMGKEGRITRTTGHLFGNYLMYAPLTKSAKTADGQIPVETLKKIITQY